MINSFVSAVLGIGFVVLGTATVFLMYHLWGYPFDKATRTSAAPKGLMLLHRILGFTFLALYIFMMVQMVPRLLRYQVEFPPRTVAHIILGISIGFLLIVKISIIRFFRHLEEWMPFLGTGLLLCTWLLVALSVPFTFRERQLRSKALGGEVASTQNLERLKLVLPTTGVGKKIPIDELATKKSLDAGREVLLTKCVQCHDLKTILTKPRAPKDWAQTVERMTEKPVIGEAFDEKQQWQVTTYLIAITPELQQSAKKAREQKEKAKEAKVAAVVGMEGATDVKVDIVTVKPLFESKCTECHELADIENHPWKGEPDAKDTLERMLDNGLEASPEELEQLRQYLVVTYVKTGKGGAATATTPADKPAEAPSTATTPTSTGATASAPKPGDKPKRPEAKAAPGDKPTAPGDKPTTTATTAATTPAAAEGAAPTCGTKPLPDCPLQAFMKGSASGASASEDGAALANVFDRIGRMAPAGYGGWSSIASDGATAARGGDIKAARGACSSCHSQYRAKYKAELRSRPIR